MDLIEKHLFRKIFQSAGQLNTCFQFVRTSAPKIPVQIFAYLISKLWCSIYQNLDIHGEKSASLELPHRLDRKKSICKAFSKCSQENYLLCVYPEFTSEISLVISLHDWLTLRALAVDKNCIRNRLF